ncbi:hypothetical protein LJ737_04450 [Hymenobacter sp. 15J16-1T3B]|uniref:LamG-like jellyroll fold domain-containing protein n=1 Tax=Hymenobacter sp. 15J16-1T3B TaxID=2886941 RepID=UPI001D12A50D|nr:LamG-like jellyroll fold domain-containing protein [Hymenobacter sp. 15J16-1T3B]MCC3156474.1 hypothetical protein [Hymenobacter sp. 15J16-1T3B]
MPRTIGFLTPLRAFLLGVLLFAELGMSGLSAATARPAAAAPPRHFAPLAATISAQTNVSCNGGSNGSATVTASGGTVPYFYSWAPFGGSGANATSLPAGTYYATVYDAAGASATATVTITQPAALALTGTATNTSCNGGSDGSATVTVSGGTAPYFYSWSPAGGTGATASGRPAGTYTVTVTDTKGCSASKQFNIGQPAALTASLYQVNPACSYSSDGWVQVTPSGGTSPYTYQWSPGHPTGYNTNTISNLSGPSQYSVLVTDAKGCTVTKLVGMVAPLPLNLNVTATNPSTAGGADGSASASASGGRSPFQYRWTRTSVPAATLSSTSASVSGLTAGTYTAQVTDYNNCTTSRSFTVLDPTDAPVLSTPANGASLTTAIPSYAGTAPVGSTVTVYVDGSNAGSTTADAGGSWSFSPAATLAFGAHTVYARAQLSGYALSASSNTNSFTVLNPATYTSSTAEQPNLDRVVAGRSNQEILRVAVTIGGGPDLPLSLQSLGFATTGSSNAAACLTAARVYYTGSSSALSTTTPFGTAVSGPDGAFTITGSQPLSAGLNYFWLVYDVSDGAAPGLLLDAELTSLTVGGTAYAPTVGSPVGSRTVVNADPTAGYALRGTGGTTPGYVNLGNNPVTLGGQYTQAVWLKPSFGTGTGFYGVLGNGTGNSAGPYLGVGADGRIEAGFGTGSTIRSVTTPAGTLTSGQWSYVVVTFDGSQLLIYHNGSLLGSLSTTSVPVNPTQFCIGNLSASPATNYFPGSLDEVSFWNRALSQAEIRQLRHLTLEGTETGLLAYLQFNAPVNLAFDAVRGGAAPIVGATVVSSTAPVGYGRSASQTVTGAGAYNFAAANAAINFSAAGSAPYEVVVSRIDGAPLGTQPANASLKGTYTPAYWIVDRYSFTSFAATVTFTLGPNDLSPADAASPANLRLFKRDSNGDGAFDAPIAASSVDAAAGTVAFPVTSFSQAVIGTFGSSPLPVELLRFTAERRGQDAWLRWTTAQELNNDHFEVEASPDGQTFQRVGSVAGQGTSSSAHDYQFTDAGLLRYGVPLFYYRLRQVDTNGAAQLSAVQAVLVSGEELQLRVWPNPARQAVHVSGGTPGQSVQLLDAVGRVVATGIMPATGALVLTLPGHLPLGIYAVRVQGRSTKLVIQ